MEYSRRLRDEKRRMASWTNGRVAGTELRVAGCKRQGLVEAAGGVRGGFNGLAAGACGGLEADAAVGNWCAAALQPGGVRSDAKRWRLHDLARDLARSRLEAAEGEAVRGGTRRISEMCLAGGTQFLIFTVATISCTVLALFDLERANILPASWAGTQSDSNKSAAHWASDSPNAGAYLLSSTPARAETYRLARSG